MSTGCVSVHVHNGWVQICARDRDCHSPLHFILTRRLNETTISTVPCNYIFGALFTLLTSIRLVAFFRPRQPSVAIITSRCLCILMSVCRISVYTQNLNLYACSIIQQIIAVNVRKMCNNISINTVNSSSSFNRSLNWLPSTTIFTMEIMCREMKQHGKKFWNRITPFQRFCNRRRRISIENLLSSFIYRLCFEAHTHAYTPHSSKKYTPKITSIYMCNELIRFSSNRL